MHTVCIHPPPCLQVINAPKMGKPGVNIILEEPTVTNKSLLHQPMASNSPEIMGFSGLRIGSRSGDFRGYNRNSLETTIPNLKSVCSNSSPAWRYGNRRSTAEPSRLAIAANRAADWLLREGYGRTARSAADPYDVDFQRFGAISGQTKH